MDFVPQMMSHMLASGSVALVPAMNVTNFSSTAVGSTPIMVPNAKTISLSLINHSRINKVLIPIRNTLARSPMNSPASGRPRTVLITNPVATIALPM